MKVTTHSKNYILASDVETHALIAIKTSTSFITDGNVRWLRKRLELWISEGGTNAQIKSVQKTAAES